MTALRLCVRLACIFSFILHKSSLKYAGLTKLFDAEDDRLGAKIRRFRFFKQALIFGQVYKMIKDWYEPLAQTYLTEERSFHKND